MAEYEIFDPNENNQEKKPKKFNVSKKLIIILIIIVILGGYFLTALYSVGTSEVALVKTFGRYSHTVGPGINIHLPYPFQSHTKIDVRSVRTIEIGFRSRRVGGAVNYSHVEEEAHMITGDENIISIYAVIQYRITDPVNYFFNVVDDVALVKWTTESVLRETVALSALDSVLTSERAVIAMDTARFVQEHFNLYNSGITVENVYLQDVTPPQPVVAAFDDVNNARQDRERLINEANKYRNEIIPRTEGRVQEILREAESFAFEKVALATGETERFLAYLEAYDLSPSITRKRIIYDSLNELLSNSKIKIISDGGNQLNLLNLDKIIGGDLK